MRRKEADLLPRSPGGAGQRAQRQMNAVNTEQSFSVATLNFHGGLWPSPRFRQRSSVVGQTFEQLTLDLIHLQEVWSYPLLWALGRQLPSYPYVIYQRGLLGPQAGLVTFSRLPLHFVSFTDIPPVGEPRKRILLNRIKRAMKKKGALVCFLPAHALLLCNVHLVANGDGDWSAQSRYYQAHEHDCQQLAHLVDMLAAQQHDLLIAGDFNVAKCSPLYQHFVEAAQVLDVFGEEETPTFQQALLPAGKTAHCTDYLFVRPAQQPRPIEQTVRLFDEPVFLGGQCCYLSDHVGLLARFAGSSSIEEVRSEG